MSSPSDSHGRPDREPKGFDPVDGAYHLTHDWEDPSPLSYTVLRAVAAITGEEPHDLDPLRACVDPDALDKLFETDHPHRTTGRLRFDYQGCLVTVYASGQLVILPPDADATEPRTGTLSD